uniref:Small ribosomal subunit protein uS3m n=2 Tax=Monilinia fructicola TaxID=38448 RepID=A0A889XPT8_MONFR|nr:ribosomal protein S3 [Monilinia fructicola]QRF72264.1 ribosomal protein S3 [Monilinia fructicola]QYB19452.1 ribosomal protein S3 [Monilinia fructicola]QYB19514.1 ribosomal protein S3 [Monilinia fructicola]QYB19576.1 ribosomal protein S3 [Monilinia fructicola]QYB19636.1 ribosomal protein S3 [Monilinia fructicola]
MGKQNYKISTIKPAPACHAILLAPHKQAKKTNGSRLKDFFDPYPNRVGMEQKQDAKPLIFKKNQKDVKVIPLKVKTSDTGQMRHFTPAAQEWKNSIYAYNKNYIKLLPVADNNFMSLVKSYFNFYFKNKKSKKSHKKGQQNISRRKRSRSRGLSAKKIFVAKGDLKHTSSKAVITLYFYNTEKKFLIRKIKKQIFDLYRPNKRLKRFINVDRNNKEIITYNRPFSLKEYLRIPNHYTDYVTLFKKSFVEKLCKYFDLTNKHIYLISNLVESKVLSEDEKLLIFKRKLNSLIRIKYPDYMDYMRKVKLHYLNKLTLCIKLLTLNQIKFKHAFLLKLRYLVSQIYNKNVVFNLVNLKKMHLNSDIFTQAVSLKLKNRENRLYRVLKKSLNKVKLPNISIIKEKSLAHGSGYKNNNEQLLNKMRNLKINSLFTFDSAFAVPSVAGEKRDLLNKLLLIIFPYALDQQVLAAPQAGKKEIKSRGSLASVFEERKERPVSLRNYILRSLKHMKMRGIRIEAKGRLTRRFTASRSVFKMKWKGGLKNVDSSFKGLSTVILRGHVKSNVQYSMLHSKNRNGAFGVKGWVSSKDYN